MRDELMDLINNGYSYIPAEKLADNILALFQKLVASCKDKDEIVKLLNRVDNDSNK